MAFTPRTLLLIPLTLIALAGTPAFADTVIVEQSPPVVVVHTPPPPPPVYYGHWAYGPRPYWVHPHYYGYARPYGYGWHHGYYWR